MRIKLFSLVFLLVLVSVCTILPAKAQDNYQIFLDQPTIEKGYTVVSADDNLKLSLTPGILSEASLVEINRVEEMVMPWDLKQLSEVYKFEFQNKEAYDHDRPFYIQFNYDEIDDGYKQVFFFDKNYQSWRPLPTWDFPEEKFVRSLIHLPFAQLAVFSYNNIMGQGEASWYAYKGGNFAASPDFPKGSLIRVYNQANDKFVDVVINDFGPDRSIFPRRAIDLDKVAFKAISPISVGIIDVRIEVLYIPVDSTGRVMGLTDKGAFLEPQIEAEAAVVIRESDGKILWEKNSSEILPIASLSKLMAVKVFLEHNNDLSQVVEYSAEDEEYNYQYVNKWESARVKLVDKDQVTINDLVYSSLVGSANNAVETLARYSNLSRNQFIQAMNDKAKEWGANNTSFVEPTGLSPRNVSSVLDYAIITREALKDPIVAAAASAKQYSFSTINTNKKYYIYNTNSWLRYDQLPFTASKTGYLHEAGYCLLARMPISSDQVIAVVLGAFSRAESLFATKDALTYGQFVALN